MESPAILVRRAREAAALEQERLAVWARLEPEQLAAIERGDVEPSWSELDRCARVFGLRLDDLLEGRAGQAPMTTLLRSDREEHGLSVRENLTLESCELLGEFQRVLRDIDELERALGIERPALDSFRDTGRPDLHPGDRRARTVRTALGLGEDPVPSMVGLLHRLGIHRVVEHRRASARWRMCPSTRAGRAGHPR